MENQRLANIVRLARRVPLAKAAAEDIEHIASVLKRAIPDHVLAARGSSTTSSSSSSSTCAADDTSSACEKPASTASFTIPIALGVIIPIVLAIVLFAYLQRRHVQKQREEDANDPTQNLDFGMSHVPRQKPKNPKLRTMMDDEKSMGGQRQISLDLANTSPYLLAPELQHSRESLHSLSRTIHQADDPYRPVTQAYGDSASMRSKLKNDGSSIYTRSSVAPSRMNESVGSPEQGLLRNAAGMSRTNPPPAAYIPPTRQNSVPPSSIKITPPSSNGLPAPGSIESPIQGVQSKGFSGNHGPLDGYNSAPFPGPSRESYEGYENAAIRNSNNYLGSFIAYDPSADDRTATRKAPPPSINTLPTNTKAAVRNSEISDYGDGIEITPPSPVREIANNRASRYSMDVPPEEFVQAGLGAPGFDAKRLSMGFRPLPPDATSETEDPETRANRIRSFYKEYFDDSKPAPKGQYIEDYDQNFNGGDATYFDPASNAFVMPYAEPVTRRAMTPPPSGPPRGPRFQGQGMPRPRNGSMGAGSLRGPMSYNEGPRASSSASQRGFPAQKRPLPPPTPLSSLPTPSKLKDDSFSLLGSIEFAPELSIRDKVAGRSESPFGERRPYSPAVPAFAPLASAYDDITPLPSPHLLRNSSTFTSLDFAAPKRIRDPDSMSDAGSIRSNKSGVSAIHANAIRNGAYRVSKIPQDVVFTKDDMVDSLKPQWGMRSGQ